MVNEIYSIGYADLHIRDFIELIDQSKIQVVVDVRSIPYSKRFSNYNKENLQLTLNKYGIHYRNYAKEFGARQKERHYYSQEGFLDFELFCLSEIFLSGFNKVKDSMERGYTFVLMCAEKDPIECHRTIMVSRIFHSAGYKVKHILQNGKTVTQNEIEKRLLDIYFPNRNQISLFESLEYDKKPEKLPDLLAQSYRKRNSEIGYRLQEVKL